MRILALCKRRPQGRDLFTQPYGRFYHLPRLLAERGHEVHLLLLSYRREPAAYKFDGTLHWHTTSALPWVLLPYFAKVRQLTQSLKPDWIIGFSDTWYGILAQRLAAAHGVQSLIDAYDNYESYIPWAKPLHWAWRKACKRTDALCAAGPGLLELIAGTRETARKAIVPMAADPVFSRRDRDDSRRRLGLPIDLPLVGYCGSLYRNRGIESLFEALENLCSKHTDLKIVVSGRRQKGVEMPLGLAQHVIELGYLTDEKMPLLLNAMDVLLVINQPSDFGNFSYPAKLYEAMQCGVPVIATAATGTEWILHDNPECLIPWDDPRSFADSISKALRWGRMNYANVGSWEESAHLFSLLLESGENSEQCQGTLPR